MIFDPLSPRNGLTRFKWDSADKDVGTVSHEHDGKSLIISSAPSQPSKGQVASIPKRLSKTGFHEFQPTLTAKLSGTEPPSILSTTQGAPGRPATETADEQEARTNDGSKTGNSKHGLLRWFKHSLSHLVKDLITKMVKEPTRPTPSGKNKDERGPTTFLVSCCVCLSSIAAPSKENIYGRKYSCFYCNFCGVCWRFPELDWASSPSRDTPLPAIIEFQWNTPLIPPKSSVPVLIYSCLFPCSL